MTTQTRSIADILDMGLVMPVIVIDHAEDGVALADALLTGGLQTIEVTLRTPAALCAIKAIAEASRIYALAPDDFAKSPMPPKRRGHIRGITWHHASSDYGCAAADLPLLPGASTVSEMMHMLEAGFTAMKFFPASATGGISFIKSLASSSATDFQICPTGGISATTAPDWLALPNVKCVGGSWVAPRRLIHAGDFAAIEALARDAASLAD